MKSFNMWRICLNLWPKLLDTACSDNDGGGLGGFGNDPSSGDIAG